MYTTNAIESINSLFRKITKKGAFPNENALFKLLYLRVTELYKKWDNSTIYNWAMVRNELDAIPNFKTDFVNIVIKFFDNFIYDTYTFPLLFINFYHTPLLLFFKFKFIFHYSNRVAIFGT